MNRNFSIWIQSARPFSLTASMIPVLVGAVLAVYYNYAVSWILFPLVVAASVLLQAATNMISDYHDFQHGVDQEYTFGSSKVLTDGLLKPRQLFIGSLVVFGIVCLLGLILVAVRGVPLLILGVIGLLGAYLYTGKPFSYKYLALGDAGVFILMGPLMVIGSFVVLAGSYDHRALYVSLPIGCLVTAILHANNIRDMAHDKQAGVKTMANVLGLKYAKLEYSLLVLGAYFAIPLLIGAGVISPWAGIVFLSLPMAVQNIKLINGSVESYPEAIASADEQTAKLHLVFGVLLIMAIMIGSFLS